MTKWLLVLLVVCVGLYLLLRRPSARDGEGGPPRGGRRRLGRPVEMLTCAHCGVHLPQDEAVLDPAQRPYCSDAHRSAGPR